MIAGAQGIYDAFARQRAAGLCQFFHDGHWCASYVVQDYAVTSIYGHVDIMQLCIAHAGEIKSRRIL